MNWPPFMMTTSEPNEYAIKMQEQERLQAMYGRGYPISNVWSTGPQIAYTASYSNNTTDQLFNGEPMLPGAVVEYRGTPPIMLTTGIQATQDRFQIESGRGAVTEWNEWRTKGRKPKAEPIEHFPERKIELE